MNKALCFGLVVVGAAFGTWAFGWWAIPAIALIAGLMRCGAGIVAAASATAWLLLLLVDLASGNVSRVAETLAGVMGLPAAALFAATLALPALLGWSAASLGDAVRSLRATSRQPSSAPPFRPPQES